MHAAGESNGATGGSENTGRARGKGGALRWNRKLMSKLLLILALCLSSALAAPWSVSFGGCTFSGDYNGAPLERSGSCPTQSGTLNLANKGITLVKNESFAGMGACE